MGMKVILRLEVKEDEDRAEVERLLREFIRSQQWQVVTLRVTTI